MRSGAVDEALPHQPAVANPVQIGVPSWFVLARLPGSFWNRIEDAAAAIALKECRNESANRSRKKIPDAAGFCNEQARKLPSEQWLVPGIGRGINASRIDASGAVALTSRWSNYLGRCLYLWKFASSNQSWCIRALSCNHARRGR
jgi:hypothetical protein